MKFKKDIIKEVKAKGIVKNAIFLLNFLYRLYQFELFYYSIIPITNYMILLQFCILMDGFVLSLDFEDF